MSDRLPRRSFFAFLASLPAIVVGLLTGRREVPTPALPAATEQDLGALASMQLRHVERMNEVVRDTQAEHVRLLEQQLASLNEQNSKLAAQQYRVLDLQRQMLDRQAERDLAIREG